MICVRNSGMVWETANRTTPQCAPKIALHDGINNSVCKIYCKRLIFTDTGTYVYPHNLKVLGHGHVFEVWILISSGSDIIIQIRTRGFGVI